MSQPVVLPQFTGTASRCVKCGHFEAHVDYRPDGVCTHADAGFELRTDGGDFGQERMHRTCKCCGYQWDEKPLDADESQPAT